MTVQAFTHFAVAQEETTVDYRTALLLRTLTNTNILKFDRVSSLCLRAGSIR